MLLTSAAPTPYDVRFRLFGFPVRISPVFWVIALFLGGAAPPSQALVWVLAVLVSILVHELGHAFLQRAFGGRPEITLYAFGGMSSAYNVRDVWWSNVLIALAGPAAGLVLYSAVAASVNFFGFPEARLGEGFVRSLALINWWWSLLNLAPIWPLDGGHVARELLVRFMKPANGIVVSLWLSVACAAVFVVFFGVMPRSIWNIALFGLLGYQSYEALAAYRAARGR